MDEEISIIDTKTRNEKIKDFFLKNKTPLISSLVILIILIISFYSYQIYNDKHRKGLSEKYNNALIEFSNGNNLKATSSMKEIIKNKDSSYSPLALYFLIDNNLIENKEEVNNLFDVLIKKTSLENEIKNLIIYKKGLYNADTGSETELFEILNPLINSESIWRSHALYLIAEYFYANNEKQKAKQFFEKILNVENSNQDLIKESQKRLNRDLGE